MHISQQTKAVGRISYVIIVIGFSILSLALIIVLHFIGNAYETASTPSLLATSTSLTKAKPFPVGVYPAQEDIRENPQLQEFLLTEIVTSEQTNTKVSWWDKVRKVVLTSGVFQQLASVQSRIIVIWSGERKEEITETISDILRWNESDKAAFLEYMEHENLVTEGTFFPDNYVVSADATPAEVATQIQDRFANEIANRYPESIEQYVPLKDALIIASLLEREAYSFEHMRIISGVIWNRLFIDMPLQIDATLQYARGSQPNEPWWPVPVPDDKYIDSLYNTYLNKGLPPLPIANPSIEAIVAALNPIASDCLFYFHDDDGTLHCSLDYAQHVASLKKLYGQGR